MPTRPSPRSERLGTPNSPAIRFTRGPLFEASLVRVCYGLSGCSPPWTDLTEFPRPPGTFTSRLPAGWSPFPPLDMTTTATGLLCWRDFHPQEWQLASLHQISRARAGREPPRAMSLAATLYALLALSTAAIKPYSSLGISPVALAGSGVFVTVDATCRSFSLACC